MFMKGELDSTGIQAAELETFLNLPAEDEITVRTSKYTGMLDIIYFGQNFDETLAPPGTGVPGDFFDDVHMRKAFAYAFPYERYIQEVWLGWPDAAKGGLLPGWPGYYESFPYEYDLDKALEELKLAHGGKYYEEGFRVPFCYQAWATGMHDIMGQLLADSWAEIDPKYEVYITLKRWPDILDGGSPLCPMQVENGPDPYYLTNIYHIEYGYSGYFGYKNEEADALMEEAQWQLDPDVMANYYIDAQKLIEEDLPGILTVYYSSFSVSRTYITGREYNPFWRGGWYWPIEKGS